MKQKTSTTETMTQTIDAEAVAAISIEDENSVFADLSASLSEIRKLKGVIGYILRSNASAMIDLAEQDKIIDYAILSTQIYESSHEIGKQFNIDEAKSVLVEYKNLKVLCMNLGENRISVFMDKLAAHALIIKRILI